jgi:hypothetical protein
MPVTYDVVVYFDRDPEGDLKAGDAMEATLRPPSAPHDRSRTSTPAPSIRRRANFKMRGSWRSLERSILMR